MYKVKAKINDFFPKQNLEWVLASIGGTLKESGDKQIMIYATSFHVGKRFFISGYLLFKCAVNSQHFSIILRIRVYQTTYST